MTDYPKSIMVFDPGKTMGVAYIGPGMDGPKIGTWRFKDSHIGANYLHFLNMVGEKLKHLPDCQLGIELMTIVPHVNPKSGVASVDAKQVQMSSGWPNMLETMIAQRKMRPLEHIAIGTWRSRTHGKVFVPKELKLKKQAERSKWLKIKAREFCEKNEWEYSSDDAAEAACMLDYMRQEYEPGYKCEPAKATSNLQWADGSAVMPLKNKTIGVICAECRWNDFDDFCRSQGCSASNPILHIP